MGYNRMGGKAVTLHDPKDVSDAVHSLRERPKRQKNFFLQQTKFKGRDQDVIKTIRVKRVGWCGLPYSIGGVSEIKPFKCTAVQKFVQGLILSMTIDEAVGEPENWKVRLPREEG